MANRSQSYDVTVITSIRGILGWLCSGLVSLGGIILFVFFILPMLMSFLAVIGVGFRFMIVDPGVSLYWFVSSIINPFLFVGKCTWAGHDLSHCWNLSYYYPMELLYHCWNLGIEMSKCGSLIDRFPYQFDHYCLMEIGLNPMECWNLLRMAV